MIEKYRQCGRDFLTAAIPLLETQRESASVDLYDPVADEVIGGLFARVFRYLDTFLLDYHLWASDLGCVVRRMMLESLFYMHYLTKQDKVELFQSFQTYGIGQEKLYKLQLRKMLEEGEIRETESVCAYIDSDLDEEISDELVRVSLKNFDSVRDVAIEAGMKTDYVLHYQPDSTFVHGHWPGLRLAYLEQCQEPLYRSHLQPSFSLPGLDPSQIGHAFDMFLDAYTIWRERYNLPDEMSSLARSYFEGCASSVTSELAATEGGTEQSKS